VVLTLANNSVHCLQNLTAAMLFVSRAYSADLKNLILSVSLSLSLSLSQDLCLFCCVLYMECCGIVLCP